MEQIRKYFNQVYNETYDKTLAYVLTKCGSNDVVEDILQEIYLELLKVLEQKKAGYIKSPEAFVLQLAKSKVYRYYSERERQKVCDYVGNLEDVESALKESDAVWEDVLIDKLTAREVMEYLAEKDDLTKEIFYQHFFKNKAIKEIAEAQGVKEFAVKNRLYRTLKELKGIKRFALIATILLLAALLAKPVYTLAENMISQVKKFFIEERLEMTMVSAEEREQRKKDYILASIEAFLDGVEWENEEAKEEARRKMLESNGMEE